MNVLQQIYNISRPLNHYLKQICNKSSSGYRFFTTSTIFHRREIQETTVDNTTIVQGTTVPIDYDKQLDLAGRSQQACPLCRLGLTVRYTDVLILRQFLTTDGDLLPRKITGLCYYQHKGIRKSVEQAKRAGLLSELRPDLPPEMTNHMADWKWKKYNVYFEDEDKELI